MDSPVIVMVLWLESFSHCENPALNLRTQIGRTQEVHILGFERRSLYSTLQSPELRNLETCCLE